VPKAANPTTMEFIQKVFVQEAKEKNKERGRETQIKIKQASLSQPKKKVSFVNLRVLSGLRSYGL
jgi:hypothetical protein